MLLKIGVSLGCEESVMSEDKNSNKKKDHNL